MNRDELQAYLSSRYDGYESFLDKVIFPLFGKENFIDEYGAEYLSSLDANRRLAEDTGITSMKKVGSFYISGEPLVLYDITVSDHILMARNRVNIQRLVRQLMVNYSCAFLIFHYDNDDLWDWRFSYCHKGKDGKEFTDSKRFTFLLGPGQSCKTATDNFDKLLEKGKDIKVSDIEDAFSVEVLSKKFFDRYKAHYQKFVDHLCNTPAIFDEFARVSETTVNKEATEKAIRDFVKRMLGRIVFLHFLQKKGWLGVKRGNEWGTGDKQFMHNLFLKASDSQKENFLSSVLVPLYSGALDTDRSSDDDLFDTGVEGIGVVKIPYLNGGLFECGALDSHEWRLPEELFRELLKMFSQYNFTIDENDPDDAEVGVDPEMLGRIFENLLEDNKDKGAYYTPKEIVRYMSRESLIAYLQTDLDEGDREKVRKFVMEYDAEVLGVLKDEIDQKLKDVKICDPAIGSGAFPMGLLRELFFCRTALEPEIVCNAAEIKREIIQNNIYGVDIEYGAVEIARLRFWLSLVVDEKSPATLPNLDFKIMQGNSLMERYRGVPLQDITRAGSSTGELIYGEEVCDDKFLKNRLHKYFSTFERNERKHLLYEVDEAVKKLIIAYNPNLEEALKHITVHANSSFFLWHTWFLDVFEKGGFDIVIGNPPYGATYSDEEKEVYKKHYKTTQTIKGLQKGSLDTFTLFIERGYDLMKKDGVFAYIVPIAITSSDSVTGVHNLLMKNCDTIHVSSYSVRPKPVFENAMVNVSILMFRKTKTPCQHLFTSKMHRRGEGFNLQHLIDNLKFVEVNDLMLYGRIPKIDSEIEKNILNKLFKHSSLSTFVKTSGSPIIYRYAGGRYFNVITNYSNGSSAERSIYFEKKEFANSMGCILSSSLSHWFYQIYSDNHNWKSYEIENFPIPALSDADIAFLDALYARYLTDIEAKANVRTSSGTSTYKVSTFKEYKIVYSKPIIDEIDDYICPLYGLTEEETEFIKNYELEFRLAGE